MTKIAQRFARELPKLLETVAADIAQMIDTEFEITCAVDDIGSTQELLAELTPAAVCCRSRFIKNTAGVGGLLIPRCIAQGLAHAMNAMDPPGEDDEFDWDGQVGEAMSEFWNIAVGSWSKVASPDYRMSGKTDERAVELYPSSIQFPGNSGVFPEALAIELKLGELTARGALFLPIRAAQGSAVRDFQPPDDFVMVTCTETVGEESRDSGATPSAGPKPLAQSAQPVVFLDYSGLVLPWIRQRIADKRLQYLLSTDVDPSTFADDEDPPVAAVLAGVDLKLLEQLKGCSYVEIRPRS